ncbi:MAG: tyrosine-type recombinase/integrase [Candidatus Bathyarchaeia archaeon]
MSSPQIELINLEDPAISRWLDPVTKPSTKASYKTAIRAYLAFTGLTASQLIDEAVEDQTRDIRQRRGIVLNRIVGFYQYLKKDYPIKRRGRCEHTEVKKGLSDKAANLYITAIRSFYSTFDVEVRLKGRYRLPKPKVTNRRMRLSSSQVKLLVDHARNPRDKAVILTMFQSGMDVSTLCSLKYGDIRRGLESGEIPLKLDLYRPKTGVEYFTFLGRDAIEAVKVYLRDLEARGVKLQDGSPLFQRERPHGAPLQPHLVQNMLREVALKAGFIDPYNNGRDINPLSPHALRESFGSIMINSGVPDTIVDFWLGHAIGEMAEAYKGLQFESLRKMYLERERLLSITPPPVDPSEIERKVDAKVDERIQSLQKVIENLSAENLELKSRMARLELENTELTGRINRALEEVAEIRKLLT